MFQQTMLPILLVLLLFSTAPVSGIEGDEEFFAPAAALMAVQLYTEIGPDLASEFVREGRSRDVADALSLGIVGAAAQCSIAALRDSELPQVQTFLELLRTNDAMNSVTRVLARTYTTDQLDRMQSQVSQVVNACLREARINVRDHVPDSA